MTTYNKMKRRSFIWTAGAFSAACLLYGTAIAAERKNTNIVFFLVDDMGWQCTSEPFWTKRTKLNDVYKTPNIERFARQGVKFTQAYACAVCSPTRISIMTGANAARHKVTTWTLKKNWSADSKGAARNALAEGPPDWNMNGMSQEPGVNNTYVAVTLPELLRKEGYRTIHVGKAHFAADDTPSEDPRQLGFDVNIAGHCAGAPGSYYGRKNFQGRPILVMFPVWTNTMEKIFT